MRNLVICCDGTNNEFGEQNTNVVRLVQVLNREPFKQRLYYDPGVGTLPEPGAWGKMRKWWSQVRGLAFGAGLNWKVQEAYTYIMNIWEPGDRLFLFGFSRGAYTVRVLAGMLYGVGLLPRGSVNMVPYAMRLFKGVRDERKEGGGAQYWADLCDRFRWTFARPTTATDDERHCHVHFLGVWDTVSSVGWVWDPAKFPYTARNPGIDVIRHAVSVDERRWFFRQNLMNMANRAPSEPNQDLVEVWFSGVHCDVGGGYPPLFSNNPAVYSELWREPFDWLRSEAEKAGLYVDPRRLRAVQDTYVPTPSPWMDPQHESLRGPWWIAQYCPKQVWNATEKRRHWKWGGRDGHRLIPKGSLIHNSTLRRICSDQIRYAPPNLSATFRQSVRALSVLPDALPYDSGMASSGRLDV